MATMYFIAGALHFLKTGFYLSIMPPYLPFHHFLVYFSGFVEIALGILLFFKNYANELLEGVIILLIMVFPANVYHFTSWTVETGVERWQLALRLPMQFLLIAWAYWHTRGDSSQGTVNS